MYSTAINTINEQLKIFHNGLSQQNSKAINKLKDKVTNAGDTLSETELLLTTFNSILSSYISAMISLVHPEIMDMNVRVDTTDICANLRTIEDSLSDFSSQCNQLVHSETYFTFRINDPVKEQE